MSERPRDRIVAWIRRHPWLHGFEGLAGLSASQETRLYRQGNTRLRHKKPRDGNARAGSAQDSVSTESSRH